MIAMYVTTDRHQTGRTKPAEAPQSRFDFSPWGELRPLPGEETAAAPTPADPVVPLWERVAAVLLLLLLSPVILAVAIAILAEPPRGPVFYSQERVGLDRRRRARPDWGPYGEDRRQTPGSGRSFNIVKFRTMVPNAERLTGPVWAQERDPRITRVGQFLRLSRLDEIPQLINVVQGHMRLIGPRPERPHFVTRLVEEIPEYAVRQKVPPGITGLAQVKRHYDATVEDVRKKVQYDVYYVTHRCGLLDLKILLATIDVVLRRKGAR